MPKHKSPPKTPPTQRNPKQKPRVTTIDVCPLCTGRRRFTRVTEDTGEDYCYRCGHIWSRRHTAPDTNVHPTPHGMRRDADLP